MPTALITGVSGQDGSYLAEFLLSKGYHVVGTMPDQKADQKRIRHIYKKLEIVNTDLLNQGQVEDILRGSRPDEIYNLAARASSNELWTEPVLTGELNALTVTRILDAIRKNDYPIRFVQ